jgi:hypothetical protein
MSPSNLFISFDTVVPPRASSQVSNSSSARTNALPDAPTTQKKRWNILKAVFGSSRSTEELSPNSSSDESETTVSDGPVANEKTTDGNWRLSNGSAELCRPKTAHQPYTFRFSLEWMERQQWPSKNKRLYSPSLPVASQLHLQLRRSTLKEEDCDTTSDESSEAEADEENEKQEDLVSDNNIRACKASAETKEFSKKAPSLAADDKLASSKYAGRALAEWAQIVSECDSFFSRRRDEGVPCDRLVETPTLGVDGFRK